MSPHPRDAWVIGRLLIGHDLNGEIEAVSGPFRPMAERLAAVAPGGRPAAWETMMAARDDRDELVNALANVDPDGPPPEADAPEDDTEGDGWEPIRFRSLPPAAPFPLDVLPDSARVMAEAVARSVACPVDYPAVAIVAVASGLIGRSASLLIKPGYFASASLYVALVGSASSGKTPTLDMILAPARGISTMLYDAWKAAMKAWKSTNDEDRGDPPILERIITTDPTTEAIGPILVDNPRGLFVAPDEMTKWVMSMDQYKGGRGGDRPFYLSAWSGTPICIDRAKNMREPIVVPHPLLSVLGGMVPDKLRSLSNGADDGFMARLLFTFPEEMPRQYSEEGVPSETADDWHRLARALWDRPLPCPDGTPTPHVVRLSPEAKRAWVEWCQAHYAEVGADDFPEGLKSAWGKLEAYMARLTLIVHLLHLAADPTRSPDDAPPDVPQSIIDGAARLIAYHKSHARCVHAAMGGKGHEGGDDVRALIRWILRNDRAEFSTRDVRRNFDRFHDDDAALMDALAWMARHNLIRPKAAPEASPPQPGRKRAPTFEVNPALKTSPRFRRFRQNANA